MENILNSFAVPFQSPTYRQKLFTNLDNSKAILAMGDIIAEELQDSNSEASIFLGCLRNTSRNRNNFLYNCLVRYKPENNIEGNIEIRSKMLSKDMLNAHTVVNEVANECSKKNTENKLEE